MQTWSLPDQDYSHLLSSITFYIGVGFGTIRERRQYERLRFGLQDPHDLAKHLQRMIISDPIGSSDCDSRFSSQPGPRYSAGESSRTSPRQTQLQAPPASGFGNGSVLALLTGADTEESHTNTAILSEPAEHSSSGSTGSTQGPATSGSAGGFASSAVNRSQYGRTAGESPSSSAQDEEGSESKLEVPLGFLDKTRYAIAWQTTSNHGSAEGSDSANVFSARHFASTNFGPIVPQTAMEIPLVSSGENAPWLFVPARLRRELMCEIFALAMGRRIFSFSDVMG